MFNFHQKSDGMTWFFKVGSSLREALDQAVYRRTNQSQVDEVPSDTGGIGNGAGEAETV